MAKRLLRVALDSARMGIARALGNYIGNCVATVVVAAWEGDIDRERAHKVLDGKVDVDAEGPRIGLQPVPAE